MLRKTKGMAQQTPTDSNERKTIADNADRHTWVSLRELQAQKATKMSG